jgi:hypothetical protein
VIQEGIRLFNDRKYWHAHEAWESAWRALAEGPERTHLQGLIQACGVFHLIGIGRVDPAARMAISALEKLRLGRSGVDVPGLEEVLEKAVVGAVDTLALAESLVARLRC